MPDQAKAPKESRAGRREPAYLRCRVSDGMVDRHTQMANLGTGGARVLTAAPPAPGQIVWMSFRLSDAGPDVTARANVVWRREGKRGRAGTMGVEFLSVSHATEITTFLGRE